MVAVGARDAPDRRSRAARARAAGRGLDVGAAGTVMERLSRTDYFEEALRLMADGGAGHVTVTNLCRALSVTTGSFYYHFRNLPTFMREFLSYWEEAYSLRYIDEAATIADPGERLHYLFRMASRFHHRAECAIRAHAVADRYAAEMQQRVDGARVRVVADCLQAGGLSAAQADVAARFALAVLVGAQHTITPLTPRSVQRMLEVCGQLAPGLPPA